MPIAILAVWRFIKPLWPYIAIALAVLAILRIADRHGYHSRDSAFAKVQLQARNSHAAFILEQANFRASVASWRKATADAQAADKAHAEQIARTDADITQETQNETIKRRDAARASADAYSRGLLDGASGAPRQAADGGSSIPPVRTATGPGALPAASRDASVLVADNRACADAVTKAEGWQAQWAKIVAVPGRE